MKLLFVYLDLFTGDLTNLVMSLQQLKQTETSVFEILISPDYSLISSSFIGYSCFMGNCDIYMTDNGLI